MDVWYKYIVLMLTAAVTAYNIEVRLSTQASKGYGAVKIFRVCAPVV